jgi:AraC family transcriptional regulator
MRAQGIVSSVHIDSGLVSAHLEKLEIHLVSDDAPAASVVQSKPYRLEHVTTPGGAAYDFAWDGEHSYLAWHDIVLRDGEMSGDDLAPVRQIDMRDLLTFFPKGMRANGWCDPLDRPNAFTALYFDAAWVFEQMEASPVVLRPKTYFHDAVLLGLMQRLTALAKQGDDAPRLLTDSVALTAAAELVRINRREPKRGALNADQLARVKDYMEAHLREDVSLQAIADASGLSMFHFARAFKSTTGRAPYRYVIERRLGRAKDMMANTDLSLGEIALAVGFKSAEQFSRTFSDIEGQTARTFRRAAR